MTDPLQDCNFAPYWWDEVPRPKLAGSTLPSSVDVAVIGAGYTGLHAALQTVRGGRSTLVMDAEDAGFGGSSRNGGQLSTGIKHGYEQLAARHGASKAIEILKEGQNSLAWVSQFIRDEAISCDFRQDGHFHAAHTPAQFKLLADRIRTQPKDLEMDVNLVPRAEQRSELGTDIYHGGSVNTQLCSLHPARYHQGLLNVVLAAGAQVAAHCAVTGIERQAGRFRLTTAKGTILARDVVLATDGYTRSLVPWLQRRVIPVGSYMIATEELPDGLMDRLIPRNRTITDTRKVIYYYRASPDRKRILFGGRVSSGETDPRVSGRLLFADLVRIFPELADTRVSHSWAGFIGYTFDELMHIGKHDDLHYAVGYCGPGIGTSSYFGMRVGQRVLGLAESRTALDDLAFKTRPFYTGKPWFLPPMVAFYRWRDQLGV